MAGIIKAAGFQSNSTSVRPVTFNLADMNEKAAGMLQNVQARADAILAQARREAERIQHRVQEQGRAAAIKAAKDALREELNERLKTLMPALAGAIQSIHDAKQAWLKEWADAAVRLAVKIAERLVQRQLDQSPDITADLIRETLELATGSRRLTLHLNPQDYETLGDQLEELAAEFGNLAPTDIVSDPQVTRGGCLLKSEFGQIDQQLATRLARVEEELTT